MKYFVQTISLLLALFTASAHAVVLQINSSGVLIGTAGTDVVSKLYDASLQDGSCGVFYSEVCDPSLFAFAFESLAPTSLILLGLGMVIISVAGRRRKPH